MTTRASVFEPREMVKGLRRGKVSAWAVIMDGTLGGSAGFGKLREFLRKQKECCAAARNNISLPKRPATYPCPQVPP